MSNTVDQTIFEGGAGFDWDTHNGNYDVGTGPGTVAEVLALRFKHVETSDTSAFHVSVAKEQHKELKNVKFSHSRAEDLLGQNDADLVTVAECLPLMEIEKAMAIFNQLLRPGGTLAIWFYGGPICPGSDANTPEIQKLDRAITSRSFDPVRPLKGPTWSTIRSWLDNVTFAPSEWKDVRRMKWNSGYPLDFSEDFKDDLPSAIAASEIVETREDPTFWAKEVDLTWAKGFIDAQIPRQTSYLTDEVERMYREMREPMDGKMHPITWPVILTLAMKVGL